jgi:hypothetical protein
MIFMAMIQALVFWVMILSSNVIVYQCFGGPCCLHLQGDVNGAGKGGVDIGIHLQGMMYAAFPASVGGSALNKPNAQLSPGSI